MARPARQARQANKSVWGHLHGLPHASHQNQPPNPSFRLPISPHLDARSNVPHEIPFASASFTISFIGLSPLASTARRNAFACFSFVPLPLASPLSASPLSAFFNTALALPSTGSSHKIRVAIKSGCSYD